MRFSNHCRFRRIGFIGLILLVIVPGLLDKPAVMRARQDSQQTVTYDMPVNGNITDGNFQESWSFAAPASDRISVTVLRSTDTLVPTVEIRSADGKVIARADHDSSYAQATIASAQLPAAATYTIVVSRFNDQAGKTSGSYNLAVSLLGAGADRPELYQPMAEAPLQDNASAEGELTNAKWIDVWPVHADGSEHVLFIATRTSGSLIPTLVLVDSAGKEIQRADPAPQRDRSQLDVTLLPNRDYEIRVARNDNQTGASTGKYNLTKVVLGGSAAITLVQGAAKIDAVQQGEVRNLIWQEAWVLALDQPTLLTITVTRTSGTLVPVITVLDAKNNEVVKVQAREPFTSASIDRSRFNPGAYLLVVSRADGLAGSTTGGYQLTIAQAKP